MHWVGTQEGRFDAERELILSDQSPADIVFLSAADTDLAAVAGSWGGVFGSRLRLSAAGSLRQPVAADHFVATVVKGSKLLVARLLGGRGYFPHLLQALEDMRESSTRARLLLLPGTGEVDEDLARLNDFPRNVAGVLQALLSEGGPKNLARAGELITRLLDWTGDDVLRLPEVEKVSSFGWYKSVSSAPSGPVAWLTFYRAWHQTNDLEIVDALIDNLEKLGFEVGAFYCQSLREPAVQESLLALAGSVVAPDVVLTMQSFTVSTAQSEGGGFLELFGCPVLQVPVSSGSRTAWEPVAGGLSPSEVAVQIALPEIDGRVLSSVAGFKEESERLVAAQCVLKRLRADASQIEFICQLAQNWARLRRLASAQKRVAIVLANYPNRDGRVGNGVGLDTPASTAAVLHALRAEGYLVEGSPENGAELMRQLLAGVTNDPDGSYGKQCGQVVSAAELRAFMETWPAHRVAEMDRYWPEALPEYLPVSGVQFGNVFVGIQPPRGFSLQSQAIYHSPDLPPPPVYVGFYHWIREVFRADVIIHLGKHGNLEWLPGRAAALGPDDYPRLCLGPMPHLYPFIVNNPGEGTQAKRRTGAVIVDHLTPPLTRAGLYGQMEQLERLLEEHSQAASLYPRRAQELEAEINALLEAAPWRADIPEAGRSISGAANFLCELKESQIRSGLHIFGNAPSGAAAVDFVVSLLRLPSGGRSGLLEALAGTPIVFETMGATERDELQSRARSWVESLFETGEDVSESTALEELRGFATYTLIPLLQRTDEEMSRLLSGLAGQFVPPGPAGAPTRGRIDVLPTGRNFYALDPRVVPTPTAWRCGRLLGESLLKRYFQDHGEPLKTLALVVWGTSNMRTGGDDLAQAIWLWGCEPVWEEGSGRVIDFKILPASLLGRPRVDVTLRVSGLFRDAFGDTVRLLAAIPKRLALLDEPESLNPIRAAWLRERAMLVESGLSKTVAERTSGLRVFTSGPGCYGAGILPLLDAGNWESKGDLADVFVRWGDHAVGADGALTCEPEALKERLRHIEAIAQNQDNREHDILDSDDYFQFQGGLQAAVEHLRGRVPANYHGDSSDPELPRIRTLGEELVRVLHSRALNPRWIEAMRKHGYKGAFELAATVDYLFGYSATTGLVRDHHFEAVAQKVVLQQEAFFVENNPDAMREAAARLLEAAQRGMWSATEAATVEALQTALLRLEGDRE